MRDHRREDSGAPLPAQAYILKSADDTEDDETPAENGADAPLVIAEMASEVATLTVSQAVLRLDLSEEPALLFRNSAHGGINLVYRRSDGNLGWVEPKASND